MTRSETAKQRTRCEWCGVFLKEPTPALTRKVVGADGMLRIFTQKLCPNCRSSLKTEG